MPRPRTAPPGRGKVLGRRPAVASLVGGSALPLRFEDLGDLAGLRIEEGVAHLAPAAELLDVEELGRRREVLLVQQSVEHRPVARRREQLLGLLRVEEVHERLRRLGVLALADHCGRVLDQDRLVRKDVVEVRATLLREDRLVLVADQDVALAARERVERVARALVEDGNVIEQRRDELLRLFRRLAALELRAVGGHHVPARSAGREGVGRDDLDTGLDQVVPGLDVLRIALADHERHDGVADHALMLVLVPALLDEARVDELRHVGLQRELDDVGRQAALHGTGLVAGTAVGLLERDALTRRRLVERRDDLLVRLLGGRVSDQRQALATATATAAGAVRRAAAAGDHGDHGRDQRDGKTLGAKSPHEPFLLDRVGGLRYAARLAAPRSRWWRMPYCPTLLVLHRTGLWLLMGASSVAGVAYMLRAELQGARDEPWPRRLGRLLSAALDGIGLGLCAAALIIGLGAVIARL